MTTVESLKKEYKTFKAAKTAHNLKAKSWAALAEKINVSKLQERVTELEAENAALKQQLATAQNTDSDYFVSPAAEIVYSIIKLDGEQRLKALGVNGSHYKDADKAKKWRNDLAAKVHPDKCAHPDADKAMNKVTAIYQNMVG